MWVLIPFSSFFLFGFWMPEGKTKIALIVEDLADPKTSKITAEMPTRVQTNGQPPLLTLMDSSQPFSNRDQNEWSTAILDGNGNA